MEKKIKQLLRYLQIEYVAVWVLPLLLVALYETGVMTEGAYAGDVRMDYVLQTVGILLAVGLIPLSLRLFSLSLVKNVLFCYSFGSTDFARCSRKKAMKDKIPQPCLP